jgi:hypothetical protein
MLMLLHSNNMLQQYVIDTFLLFFTWLFIILGFSSFFLGRKKSYLRGNVFIVGFIIVVIFFSQNLTISANQPSCLKHLCACEFLRWLNHLNQKCVITLFCKLLLSFLFSAWVASAVTKRSVSSTEFSDS